MPSRNTIRQDAERTYYHVYVRGVNKQKLFLDNDDYRFFMSLFARHASLQPQPNGRGGDYPHYRDHVTLLAYCLMGNHFHLMLYQHDQGGVAMLMRSIMTTYAQYFNRKYHRSGPVFESRYKAVVVSTEPYLLHISRYIHLNPRTWRTYRYSSLRWYDDDATPPSWLDIAPVICGRLRKPPRYIARIKARSG
jgi:REP element-mobilizing transposase RayT